MVLHRALGKYQWIYRTSRAEHLNGGIEGTFCPAQTNALYFECDARCKQTRGGLRQEQKRLSTLSAL